MPSPSRRPVVNPVLPVADMVRSVDFYRGLGFAVEQYDAGYAWVTHCGWEILHLAATAGGTVPSGPAGAYVHVDDADDWHAALSLGDPGVAVGAVADQPWGKHEFAVTDPDGNVVRFGCDVG